jgi:hypothetical protein
MTDIRQQIEQLKATILQDEERAASLETQAETLHQHLLDLKHRYDAVVQPVAAKLQAVKAAITELETHRLQNQGGEWKPPSDYVPVEEQYRRSWITGEKTTRLKPDDPPAWTPPEGYVSVEEQYRRAWGKSGNDGSNTTSGYIPPTPDFIPPAPSAEPSETDVKKLYRLLARRHHPDYAKDDDDRHQRHEIMAKINEAYEGNDLDTLQALAGYDDLIAPDSPDESLLEVQFKHLRLRHNRLRRRIFDLKQQIHDLEQSDLMRLKMEENRLQRQGRDLLREMAADIEREYREKLKRLYELQKASH